MPPFIEVYRSVDLLACEQRAFVLRAVGIEHVVGSEEGMFGVFVPDALARRALDELQKYESENRARSAPPQVVLHDFAALSSVVYMLVLVLCGYLAGVQFGGIDWIDAGALVPDERSAGQAWRVITALTLHADVGHLIGNLAFGGLFGFFAAQLIGPGTAWLSILLAGALGNWVNTLLMRAQQTTIGASTAVFATLGMVACYALMRHTAGAPRWAHRWAPLVVAVALLAFTGTGGERTDVLAHLTGFAAGALVGVIHAFTPTRNVLVKIPQWASGVIALVLLAGAWLGALMHGWSG
jgi:membrane associated rhomboid family serine protease